MILACYGMVLLAIGFNLVLLRAETHPARTPNDFGIHISLVNWAEQRIAHGQMVFDGWYPRLQLGLPAFLHYQSLAPITTAVLATATGAANAVAWTNYLLLATLPLSIYLGVRLFGFDRWAAGAAALVSPLLYSVTLYGYEYGSFIWRGNGIWTGLWGMWLLPLTLAFTWRAVSRGRAYALAALFLGLLIPTHFLTAYLAILALGVWVIVKPSELPRRLGRAAVVGIGGMLVGSWSLVPALLNAKWNALTQYNVGTFWSNSYGARKVLGWLVSGQIFDFTRLPVITILAGVGLAVCIWTFRREERARAIVLFSALSLAMFCGRGTVGFVVNRLPGGQDLLLHRYIVGVHLGGIVFAGIGAAWLGKGAYDLAARRAAALPAPAIVAAILAVGLVVLSPAWTERISYTTQNATSMDAQRVADAHDGVDFTSLAAAAAALGGGRIYSDAPATATSDTMIGGIPAHVYLIDADVDAVGFALRLPSLCSDVEPQFNATNPAQYNLLDVRYVITPADRPPSVKATYLESAGRWQLWAVPTTGYLQVVDTSGVISADRTNIGSRTAAYLVSSLPAEGVAPVIAFDGAAPAAQSAPLGKPPGPAGSVVSQYSVPNNGTFGGVATATRNAVVMLKASYDPGWQATVDGVVQPTQMIGPCYVGVAVPKGQHYVTFQYVPFAYYWELFTIGFVTLVALAAVPRRRQILERLRKGRS